MNDAVASLFGEGLTENILMLIVQTLGTATHTLDTVNMREALEALPHL